MRKLISVLALCALTACGSSTFATTAPPHSPWTPLLAGLPTQATILALAVSPRDPQIVFAGAYDTFGAYRSTDQARSWQAIDAGLNHASVLALRFVGDTLLAGTTAGLDQWQSDHWERIAGVPAVSVYAIGHGTDGMVYLATDTNGIYRSADGDKTWSRLPGLDGETLASVAALDSHTIFAGTSGNGAFVTHDGGATWQTLDLFRGEFVTFIGVDPRDSRGLYLRTHGGLFRSRDAGATWETLEVNDLVNGLLFDSNSTRVYAGTGTRGILFSDDDGATWQSAGTGLPPDAPMLAMAQDDAQTLLAGTTTGVFVTRDGGQVWRRANQGLGAPQVHTLALGPAGGLLVGTEDGVYDVNANGAYTPIGGAAPRVPSLSVAFAPSNPQVIYVGTYRRGIFVSRDGGATWNGAGDLFANRLSVPGLAVDPTNDRNVFARVLYERIYKSTDGGATWHAVWTGMPTEAQVGAIYFLPGNQSQMCAGTNVGLFCSRDSGESWMPHGLEQQTVFAIWVDPDHIQTWLAGATDGLYRSQDGGATWARLALANITVTVIARGTNGVLYAGTKYNGLWVSRDGGETWTRSGLNGDSVIALAADLTRGLEYVATPRGLYESKGR